MKRAVIYARSAVGGAPGARSIDEQERQCRRYCKAQGLEVAGTFMDCGASGLAMRRPALKYMIRFCRKPGRVEYAVAASADRFSRDSRGLAGIQQALASRSVEARCALQSALRPPVSRREVKSVGVLP
jgi:DNA invertase Pin-like site-specific DNA recombinase